MELPGWMRRRSTDYGRTVAFPVAVVGRDGRVRHCDFDESVRMYARRLHIAAARAADTDRARDEVEHCRARLEQLRRSYLERHAHAVVGTPTDLWGTLLAADLLAFLHRCFPASIDQLVVEPLPPPVTTPRAAGASESVALVRVGGRWGLVQAWVRGGPEGASAQAREAFHAAWEVLVTGARPDAAAPDTEQLWAAWHSPDVAVLLSGVGAWEGPVPEVHDDAPTHEEAWGAAVEAAWDHRYDEALARFEAMGADRPEALAVAQASALMALAAGHPERAAYHAEGGLLRTPEDATLRGVQALARARCSTTHGASPSPDPSGGAGLLGVVRALDALARGRYLRARRYLREVRGPIAESVRHAVRAHLLRWTVIVALTTVLTAVGLLPSLAGITATAACVVAAALEVTLRARATVRGRRLGLVNLDYASLLPRLQVDPHRPA